MNRWLPVSVQLMYPNLVRDCIRRSLRRLIRVMIALIALTPGSAYLWGQIPGTPALQQSEESLALLLRQALELYRTGQYAEAAGGLNRYLGTHPDSLPTRKLLIQCYLRLSQPEAALSHLREVTAQLPQDLSLQLALRQAEEMLRRQREREAKRPKPAEIQQWFARAEQLIRDKKLLPAEELLRQVIQEQPAHRLALLRLAEIYAGTGRFLEAAGLYRRLVRQGGNRQPEMELRLARVLAWAQHYPKSVAHFEDYLQRHPEDHSARFDLAEVYRWSGSPREAMAHYQILLRNQPGDLAARMGLALSEQALEQHSEALKEFDSILKIEPGNQQAQEGRARSRRAWQEERKRLALVAQEQKNYAEAIRALQELEPTDPADPELLRRLARLHSWSGKFAAARAYYERYLGQQPGDRPARLELAELLSWLGDYAGARQAFRTVLEAEPRDPRALLGLIRCAQSSGELDGVEPYLERLEQVEPGHAEAPALRRQLAVVRKRKMRERAERLQEDKNYAAAIEAYREYGAAYGPDPDVELRIARLYAWNRQFAQAIEEYRGYLLRYPNDATARLELADVQRWNADYDSALQNYSTLLAEQPRNPRALVGRAEALYASSVDLFAVRRAYQRALETNPGNSLAANRFDEIGSRLQPRVQAQYFALLDSDKLARIVLEPRVTFFLPDGYRLISRFRGTYTHQQRFLPATGPDLAALNQQIAEIGGTLWGAQGGLRLERYTPWGSWGAAAALGQFSDGRLSFTFGGEGTLRVRERGQLWARYDHEDAGFELNTLASLAAGIKSDSWRVRYRQQLPHRLDLSSGYSVAYLSASDRFGFATNLRNAGDVQLVYRRFRVFQPGYHYRVSGYRAHSPLYFSPGLYQAHRFESLLLFGQRRPLQFLASGSLGFGRLDGTNTLEFTVAPELSLQMGPTIELELRYDFGQSRASSFGNPVYRIHGFWLTVRFPFPHGRR